MDRKAKIENIRLINKGGDFDCTNYCNTCSKECKLIKQAKQIAIKEGKLEK